MNTYCKNNLIIDEKYILNYYKIYNILITTIVHIQATNSLILARNLRSSISIWSQSQIVR